MNYKSPPTAQSWLKIGAGDENSRVVMTERQKGGNIDTRYDYQPRNQDVQYRHSLRQGDDEWTWGAETARMDNHTLLASYSSLNTNYGPLATQLRDDSNSEHY